MDFGSVILLILLTMCFTIFTIFAVKASIQMTVDKCFEHKLATDAATPHISQPVVSPPQQTKVIEKFDELSTPAPTPISTQVSTVQPTSQQTCGNKSLNEMHTRGTNKQVPYQTMCKTGQYTDEDYPNYYQVLKSPYIVPIPTDIIGSNYDAFGGFPSPYKLDYQLYDKDEPANNPVGCNYCMQ
jgi:hypothetical protein